METGLDKLVNFLLSEIALCGEQGARSEDFHRFVQDFFDKSLHEQDTSLSTQSGTARPPGGLGRNFFEKVWDWVSNHPDIQAFYDNEALHLSLSEFEALESQSRGNNENVASNESQDEPAPYTAPAHTRGSLRPSNNLLSLRDALRQRLVTEGSNSEKAPAAQPLSTTSQLTDPTIVPKHTNSAERTAGPPSSQPTISSYLARSQTETIHPSLESPDADDKHPDHVEPGRRRKLRGPRKIPKGVRADEPIFAEPPASITGPRLFASQNRVWKSITGHSIDLKKVPAMEFTLLCIITTRGPSGISQPELVEISGQDKRSVPKRTDELAKKGYIDKKPMQHGKLRTSLLVHKRFIKEGHFLKEPQSIDDVFGVNHFILPGFVHLLHNLLRDVGVVPMPDLRKRMGVETRKWNTRAVRGAITRLEQSGMIKRVRVRKRGHQEKWLVCIKLMRDPNDDDMKNLKFKSMISELEQPEEEPLEEDTDGDGLMRDTELDMINDVDADSGDDLDSVRIPPQWTPDRMLANLMLNATEITGQDGGDGGFLRDRTTGIFWKRPLESFLSRLTDGWEKSQPQHLWYLAIVRDTSVTADKKMAHYIYRTYANFQKAVDASGLHWKGVSEEAAKISSTGMTMDKLDTLSLSSWGFQPLKLNDFHRRTGSSTLAQCRSAIVHRHRYGQHWDNSITKEIGYKKPESRQVDWRQSIGFTPEIASDDDANGSPLLEGNDRSGRQNSKLDTAKLSLLSWEQREMLGLGRKGRLPGNMEKQIRAHRLKTGDPTSLPDVILKSQITTTPLKRGGQILLTKEERRARGLPEKGRLGKDLEDQIRREKGIAAKPTKPKKPREKRDPKEPPLLTKEQRVAMGYPPVGRLPNSVIDELRRKRDLGIPFDSNEESAPTNENLGDTGADAAIETSLLGEEQVTPPIEPGEPKDGSTSRSISAKDSASTQIMIPEKRLADDENEHNQQAAKRVRLEAATSERELVDEYPNAGLDSSAVVVPSKRKSRNSSGATPRAAKRLHTNIGESSSSHPVRKPPHTPDQPSALADVAIVSSIEKSPQNSSKRSNLRSGVLSTPDKSLTQPLEEPEDQEPQSVVDYEDRSMPGLYVNPFATRRIGRGRPRKAFIATFKSEHLRELPWFTSGLGPVNSVTPFRHSEFQRSLGQGSTSATPLTAEDALQKESSQLLDARIEEIGNPPNPGETTPDERSNSVSADLGERLADTIIPTQPDPSNTPPASISLDAGPIPSTSQPRLLPAGWNAINTPMNPGASYQSPYGPASPDRTPLPTPAPEESTNRIEKGTPEIVDISETPGTEAEASTRGGRSFVESQAPVKKKRGGFFGHRGVRLGKGNAWLSRTAIIRQILDLCNGIFPANGEILAVYPQVWKEYASKMIACPEGTAIRKALQEMIRDPRENLTEVNFLFPGIGSSSLQKRSLVAYKNIPKNSPEIVKIQKAIIQAYPNKYFPPEIRQYVKEEHKSKAVALPEIDETIDFDELRPTARKLKERIRQTQKKRREMAQEKKMQEEAERLNRSESDEETQTEQQLARPRKNSRRKRTRLVSLNDKDKTKNNSAPPQIVFSVVENQGTQPREVSPASSEDVPLSQVLSRRRQPVDEIITSTARQDVNPSGSSIPLDEETPHEIAPSDVTARDAFDAHRTALLAPWTRFHASSGTFSTEFQLTTDATDDSTIVPPAASTTGVTSNGKGRKRVRIAQPPKRAPRRSVRSSARKATPKVPESYVVTEGEDSGESSEDEQPRSRPRRRGAGSNTDNFPPPTTVERLTGLTGNPHEPDYQPPTKKQKTFGNWSERKAKARNHTITEKKYPDIIDPVDIFKKLCCTLVIASSMSGDDGGVDWSIVTKAYTTDPGFDLGKAKKTWAWIQNNMAAQFKALTETFQSAFLVAYEDRKIASIEDPETYDWANLVRWSLQNCKYPEPPLPQARDALVDYTIDMSDYAVLNRPVWYKDNLANVNRAQRLLRYTFAAPLHSSEKEPSPAEYDSRKARSWIRANIATPKPLYNKKTAHDKLRMLKEPTVEKVVSDLVQSNFIRLWKLKRLRPGRNYDFTTSFAKHYRRVFELQDFMIAVKLKKDLDKTFADADPEKRAFALSRTADDGVVMAILSLLSDGRIKLVPNLPPINNEFNAPLPRLSVWGFCEGDYTHRGLDRQRLFWGIDAVPTPSYQFGNPLQPVPFPLAPKEDGSPADWKALPDPPLPGRHNPDALLPIWSSIDGETVIWPWWNRILNLVLQCLMFQPGTTAKEILFHCPKHTTEIFEIELVLDWMESVKAAKKTSHGTYELLPGFWAVFGDTLIDEENDVFGQHVKRKNRNKVIERTWRTEYNLRYSTLQQSNNTNQERSTSEEVDDDEAISSNDDETPSAPRQILRNSKRQYRIAKKAVQPAQSQNREEQIAQETTLIGPALTSNTAQDAIMIDADQDAEGEDVDAEGEPDDQLL